MAILNQFEFKKPIRATLSNSNFGFKFDHPRSGLTQKPYPKTSMYGYRELTHHVLTRLICLIGRLLENYIAIKMLVKSAYKKKTRRNLSSGFQ